MREATLIVVSIAILLIATGCGGLLGGLLPEKTPDALLAARDRTDELCQDVPPTQGMVPGTIVDDLSGLSGCWASVLCWDESASEGVGQSLDVAATELLEFRPDQKQLIHHALSELDGGVWVSEDVAAYEVRAGHAILIQNTDARGGRVLANGQVVADAFGTLIAGINAGVTYALYATLQGEFLVTAPADVSTPDVDGFDLDDVELLDPNGNISTLPVQYWIRVDCEDVE